jgi:hypothetical protein
VTCAELAFDRLGRVDSVQPLYMASYLAHYWWDREIHEFEVNWSHRPLAEVFDEAFTARGLRAASFDVMLDQVRQRRDFMAYSRGHPFTGRAIPVLHSVGWFDNLMPNSMADYASLRGHPDRSQLQNLVADSTDHENYMLPQVPVSEADDHDLSEDAVSRLIPVYLGPALEFFDVHLAGRADVSALVAVGRHLGHGDWHDAPSWPPPGALQRQLFLSAGRGLRSQPDAARVERAWLHDPARLVPSGVVNPFAFLYEYPDERGLGDRDDVLTFTSDPSEEPLDLAGPISVSVPVQTSGPSMHVFVKLFDVEPDGAAHMLVRGQVVVGAAPGADGFAPTKVELGHFGYRVRSGHRLRLQFASSDFPLYLWHPGTAENPWDATRMVTNRQRLISGGDASYVSLTVLAT